MWLARVHPALLARILDLSHGGSGVDEVCPPDRLVRSEVVGQAYSVVTVLTQVFRVYLGRRTLGRYLRGHATNVAVRGSTPYDLLSRAAPWLAALQGAAVRGDALAPTSVVLGEDRPSRSGATQRVGVSAHERPRRAVWTPRMPASGESMPSPDQWQHQDFSEDFLAALGRTMVSYAQLEKTSTWLLSALISPHMSIGFTLCTGANFSWIAERIVALSTMRISDSVLRDEILRWKTTAVIAAEERNGLIHAAWGLNPADGSGQTQRQKLKSGDIRGSTIDRSVADVLTLAQRLQAAADQAMRFWQDLWASRFLRRDIAGPIDGQFYRYTEDASSALQPEIERHRGLALVEELLRRGEIIPTEEK